MDRAITDETKRKRKRILWLKIGAGIAAAAVIILLTGRLMQKSVAIDDLLIATADTGTIDITVNATGSVAPAFEEIITSPINSRIVEVYCRAGDSVKVGTPLLRLDLQATESELNNLGNQIAIKRHEREQQDVNAKTHLSDLEMQVRVKEMTLNRLEAELQNERYLDSIGSGTGENIRKAELAVSTGRLELEQLRQKLINERRVMEAALDVKDLDINIARGNLEIMRRTLDEARLTSPREATLTYINDHIGEKVTEGTKLAVISDLAHFRVDGEIADTYAEHVDIGARVVVKAGATELEGTVSNVTPLSQNGIVKFTVSLDRDDHPRLRSGLKTDVYIKCDIVDDAIRIKKGPYYQGPGDYRLFVLDKDGSAITARDVRLGNSNYNYVQVLEGIAPGDKVVVSDLKELKEKSQIRIRK